MHDNDGDYPRWDMGGGGLPLYFHVWVVVLRLLPQQLADVFLLEIDEAPILNHRRIVVRLILSVSWFTSCHTAMR
jgi:hypothetical protein